MGTDMHGPWIEQELRTKEPKYGRGDWSCVAKLGYPLFGRDYLLFDAINGMRHGEQEFTVLTEKRELPESLSEDWFRHSYVFDKKKAKWYHPYSEDAQRIDPYASHFGFTWLTLDEVKRVQDAYIKESARRKTTPEGLAEAALIAEHDAKRARGENAGMLVIKGWCTGPERHDGLDLAIMIMEWAEAQNGRVTRLSTCFDN